MLGLKDVDKIFIQCPACKNRIVEFQITKSNQDLIEENIKPVITKILIVCCDCNVNIETIEIRGQFYIGAGQDNVMLEICDSDEFDLTIRAKLK